MEDNNQIVDNPPSDIPQNSNSVSKKSCCNFSFKKIILFFGILLLAFVAFQFYQTKTLKPTPYLLPWFNPATKIQPKTETSKLTPSPTPTINLSDTSSWKTYVNEDLGISFQYPKNWGLLEKEEEYCDIQEDTKKFNNQPCVHTTLSSTNKKLFFAAQSKLFAQYGPGRGAYWGDTFSIAAQDNNITPEKFIDTLCSQEGYYKCNKTTNNNDLTFVKVLNNEQVPGSTRKAFYYFLLNKNKNFPIIILSNERFLDTMSLQDSEKIFDQVLSTFRFTQ